MTKCATFLLALVFLSSCATYKTYRKTSSEHDSPGPAPMHSIYLLGNACLGENLPPNRISALANTSKKNEGKTSFLLLGDNFFRYPLSASLSEKELAAIGSGIAKLQKSGGQIFIVPGDKEWAKGGRKGHFTSTFIEDYLEKDQDMGNLMFPQQGCPGPDEILIGGDVVLLLINTQWLLHEWEKPGVEEGCESGNALEFYNALNDAIKRHYDKRIIVAGHHSLFSSGKYGGHYPAEAHLFPLTLATSHRYVPLPGVGWIYLGFRKGFGEHQDLQNYKYQRMKKSLLEQFAQHPDLVYVSGHEHSLEYHQKQNSHFINSGTFAYGERIGRSSAEFATPNEGFGEIELYENGEVWLSFRSYEEGGAPVFRKLLFKKTPSEELKEAEVAGLDYSDSTISTYITKEYLKENDRPGALGRNYRKEWATVVEDVPYFDLGKERGGMTIDKKGGGMQTKSLRLEAKNGKEYVLRSMQKFPENAVPEELRQTFAEKLISEQISAAHPYAAFAIPRMADAAGIYHTNPKLVYLPDDPRLGMYRKNFGGGLYLYEERPDDDRSDVESFGRSKEIISTEDVIEKIHKDGDHVIDQEFVVRSRLFDILIGDWDRHEDQWRWAKFKREDDIKLYRPIPRDRDNAFFWSDGWFMKLGTRRWGMPKFQGFHHKIRDVEGFNFNARYFDRTFMNEITLEDWISIAKDLQKKVTDEVIEKAVKDLPPEIFALHGEEIISKLKQRREDLPTYAREYYLFLAKNVDITGTEEEDLFTVERMDDEHTRVTGYRISGKDQEIKYKTYERIFKTSETEEIRIFGLDDDDIFRLTGRVNDGIKVRIIGGGGGDDIVENQSEVSGAGKQTIVYDKKSGMKLSYGADTKDKTSNKNALVNEYNRKSFQYNLVAPLLYGGYNPDDGVFVGLGSIIKTHGFRKDPYKSNHFIVGNIAPKSASFNVAYQGTFTEVLGKWNLNLNTSIFYPSYSDFFYGLGNETEFDKSLIRQDKRYYAARYQQIKFNPELFRLTNNEKHRFALGASYQLINVKEKRNNNDEGGDRFIHEYTASVSHKIFDDWRQFASLYLQYEWDTRNSILYPQRGVYFFVKSAQTRDLDDNSYEVDFSSIESNFSFYYSFGQTFRTTFAARVGGAANTGEYEFYHANKLGGSENLRGFRKQRFAGDHSAYQNTDLRIRLFSFKSILFPGDVGFVVFHDVGRVWVENDPSVADGGSDLWHRGYGAGVFLAPFGKAAITLDYSQSTRDESAVFVRLGFLF